MDNLNQKKDINEFAKKYENEIMSMTELGFFVDFRRIIWVNSKDVENGKEYTLYFNRDLTVKICDLNNANEEFYKKVFGSKIVKNHTEVNDEK